MAKVDVEGPDRKGNYRVYELYTGKRLEIYCGPNPMGHIIMLMQTLEPRNCKEKG